MDIVALPPIGLPVSMRSLRQFGGANKPVAR